MLSGSYDLQNKLDHLVQPASPNRPVEGLGYHHYNCNHSLLEKSVIHNVIISGEFSQNANLVQLVQILLQDIS